MKKYRQLVFGRGYGDCYRACMATLLQLPPEVLPNDHSPMWPFAWRQFLSQFGLAMSGGQPATGPIWVEHLWLASVPSLNLEGSTHGIVMKDHRVFHDPSTRKRYRTGRSLLGENIVLSGAHLVVTDATLLHRLDEYRHTLSEAM